VFGCDVCQDVCPWNKFQQPSGEARFAPRPGMRAPALASLARLSEHEFDDRFRGTNVRRARWAGFLRNTMIALGNCARPAVAAPPLAAALEHPEPLVRGHAAWALGRLGELAALRARQPHERDDDVRREIEAALER
jgi:epoxyqueuosine reductase